MSDQFDFTNDLVAWDDWLQQEELQQPFGAKSESAKNYSLHHGMTQWRANLDHLPRTPCYEPNDPFLTTAGQGPIPLYAPSMRDSRSFQLEGQQCEHTPSDQLAGVVGNSVVPQTDQPVATDVDPSCEAGVTLPFTHRLLYPESTCASCDAPLDTSEMSFNQINPEIYCTSDQAPNHLSLRCVDIHCGKKFHSLTELRKHFTERSHYSFNCAVPGCGTPLYIFSVDNHFWKEHKDHKYRCAQCGTGFDIVSQLDDHGQDKMHSAYVCRYPECTSEATRSAEMSRHYLKHRKSTPRHACPHCRKYRGDNGFKRKDHLRQHIRNYHHIDVDGDRTTGSEPMKKDHDV